MSPILAVGIRRARPLLSLWTLGLLILPLGSIQAAERALLLQSSRTENPQSLPLQQLLTQPPAQEITIPSDPAYGGRRSRVKAVPLFNFFKSANLSPKDQISFRCEDGFSTSISVEILFSQQKDKPLPYLAVEDLTQPWGKVEVNGSPTQESAGPTRLVWLNPHLGQITAEQWPYAVTSIRVSQDLTRLYPSLVPDSQRGDPALQRGYLSFVKNCFACHTVNLLGEARKGPDLNLPYNPTEYFQPFALKLLIRNPQSLRTWGNSQMHPFPKNELDDQEVDDVITYLAYLSKRKPAQKE